MLVPRTYPPHCYDTLWFYNCNGFIGCSTEVVDYLPPSKPPKMSITYSDSGIYHRSRNETICELEPPAQLGCCQADTDVCADRCPQENLTSDILSYILTYFEVSTKPSDSSIGAPPTSTSRSFVTSATPNSAHSSVTTEIVGGQKALPTAPSVPEATRTSVPESTSASPNAAAIAGGVAGGVAGLALVVGLLVFYRRRRKTKSQNGINKGRFSAWNSGQSHSMRPNNNELHQIKQEPSTSKSPLLLHIIRLANGVFSASSPVPPPSAPPSPLLSPLPPPPAYASHSLHGNGLERSPDHLHPSSGSPHVSYDVLSPESPPSPPPLKTRLSQPSTNSYSDGQDVSPISSHYEHHTFDNPGSSNSSVYSEVPGGLLHAHAM